MLRFFLFILSKDPLVWNIRVHLLAWILYIIVHWREWYRSSSSPHSDHRNEYEVSVSQQ